MKHTIGQIHKEGLLISSKGEPYKSKMRVSAIVNSMDYVTMETPHGMAKCLTDKQIAEHNTKYAEYRNKAGISKREQTVE